MVTYSSLQYVLRTKDVGADCLHWVELTSRNLLQCCCTKHIVYTVHCSINGIEITHITNNEVYL